MPTYTITELAQEFEITPRAIRFYEDHGLLSPKREGVGGRNRIYSARERIRLKLTLRGKRIGLTLSEIKSLVDMYESPKDTEAQLKRFLVILEQHRDKLQRQREDL
jgi:DNA-binding transcriptional MerR regulator